MTDAKTVMEKAICKAIASEEMAAANLRDIAAAAPDCESRERALADAAEETRHAVSLRKAALRDGLRVPAHASDEMMDELRAAFQTLEGDAPARSLAQDVLLEHTAIHLYEALLPAARLHAPTVAKLVEQILVEEREHVASAVVELGRLPFRSRLRSFRRALGAMLPVIVKYGRVTPETSCKKLCGACGDRCVRVDAEAAGMPLRGGWKRLVRATGASLAGIGLALPIA